MSETLYGHLEIISLDRTSEVTHEQKDLSPKSTSVQDLFNYQFGKT